MPPEAAVVQNNEATTSVSAIVNANKQDAPGRIEVVTADNFDKWADTKLGIEPKEEPKNTDPEKAAKDEHEKVEAEKKARQAEEEDVETKEGLAEHLPKDKKGKLNERFSKLATQRKEAEAKAEKAAQEAREAREARQAAEAERDALKAKYEPVKTEPDPKPQVGQFQTVEDYSKALEEWTADNVRREDAKKAAEEKVQRERAEMAKSFIEHQEAAKKEIPDYEETIKNSPVKVSNEVKDAILKSGEAGPKILHHLAKNPELADKIGQMTVGDALIEIGELRASFRAKAKETPQKENTTVAEISKAPAPIAPLKGANAPVVQLSGTDDVPKSMTYEDWKVARRAGKIK